MGSVSKQISEGDLSSILFGIAVENEPPAHYLLVSRTANPSMNCLFCESGLSEFGWILFVFSGKERSNGGHDLQGERPSD